MKKIYSLILIAALAFSLTACGNKTNNNTSGGNATTAPKVTSAPNTSNKTVDKSSVTAFLAAYGLTETDVKPAGAGAGTITAEADDAFSKNSATITYSIDNVADAQITAAVKSAFTATQNLSNDKKVYDTSGFGDTPYTSVDEVLPSNGDFSKYSVYGAEWQYESNGVTIVYGYNYTADGTYTISIYQQV